MKQLPVIEVDRVTKVYQQRSRLRRLLSWQRIQNGRDVHVVLDDISFCVERGESFGLIGANGSGKSTLLRLIAGITVPTSGKVVVRGRVVPLLELGAGFHPLLSGRENIFLNARLMGMKREETEKVLDQIISFSGLEDCIENPVYTYSSGMYVRLGFSIAVHANPDIFLVDEVLAVGDEDFQKKCVRRIAELREEKKTIVFVSHDLAAVSNLCDRVVLLARGKIISRRTPRETIEFYLRQSGRSKGIYSCCRNKCEAVFNHGRLALFYDQLEITSPQGMTVTIRQLGKDHQTAAAEWQIIEKDLNHFVAEAELPRLPFRLRWKTSLENDAWVSTIAIKCLEESRIETVSIIVHLKTLYTMWLYGDHVGQFPHILPEDTAWSSVVSPEECEKETTVIPEEKSPAPCVHFTLSTLNPYWHLAWCNSDYASGSRVLMATIRFPENDVLLAGEEREVGTLEVKPEKDRSQAQLRAKRNAWAKSLGSDLWRVKFFHGALRFFWENKEITQASGAYFTMLINGLWHDSMQFRWREPEYSASGLCVEGDSRRFPLRQVWTIQLVDGGIRCVVKVEATEPIGIDEYNFSVCLRKEYTHWETEIEDGVFPDFRNDSDQWQHLNRHYNARKHICARASSFPSIELRLRDAGSYGFHMTALNTDRRLEARVIQALRSATSSGIHLDKGTHVLFDGEILLNSPNEIVSP